MSSHEIIIATDHGERQRAQAAAVGLSITELGLVAREAGLDEWLREQASLTESDLGTDVTKALSMPAPSPFTRQWREAQGYPSGVMTSETTVWGLSVVEPVRFTDVTGYEDKLDTGVRLVATKEVLGSTQSVYLPLDVTIYTSNRTQIITRPDKLMLSIGERQLSDTRNVHAGVAQRLLVVAHNYVDLLARGQAAGIIEANAAADQTPDAINLWNRWSLKRRRTKS